MSPVVQRVVGVLVLLITGTLSLPMAAYLVDGPATENWILPVQLLVMAAIGVAVTFALPALAPVGARAARRAFSGVSWGLLAAFFGVLVSWLLISGVRGA